MNDTHQELRDLITRIVTGDGEQRENIELSDEEWAESMNHCPGDDIEITMNKADWMAMVKVAKNNCE